MELFLLLVSIGAQLTFGFFIFGRMANEFEALKAEVALLQQLLLQLQPTHKKK